MTTANLFSLLDISPKSDIESPKIAQAIGNDKKQQTLSTLIPPRVSTSWGDMCDEDEQVDPIIQPEIEIKESDSPKKLVKKKADPKIKFIDIKQEYKKSNGDKRQYTRRLKLVSKKIYDQYIRLIDSNQKAIKKNVTFREKKKLQKETIKFSNEILPLCCRDDEDPDIINYTTAIIYLPNGHVLSRDQIKYDTTLEFRVQTMTHRIENETTD